MADRLGRRRGVDIFASGTGLAGAGNIRRTVGNWSGYVVAAGDLAKGSLAVICGWLLGIEDHWILLPAMAAVVGHWNSVFSGFRGGDGLSTLGGIALALFPSYGAVSLIIAGKFALAGQRIPYTTLVSVVIGYMTLLMLSMTYDGDMSITLGVGVLAAIVLVHAAWGHLRRHHAGGWSEVDGMGPTPEKRSLKP